MTRMLLAALLALSLTACPGPSVRGDLPVSDFAALRTAVAADLEPRVLPNGKEYCAEDAKTQASLDACTGQLEDAVFLSNGDKARAMWTLDRFIKRSLVLRNPCPWYNYRCKARAREAGL